MPHKPEDHDEWVNNKKEMVQQRKSKRKNDGKHNNNKLQLTDTMKQALVTEGNITPEQVTALWANISEN